MLEHVDRYTFCSGFHRNASPSALTTFRDSPIYDRRILLLLFSYLPYSRRVTHGHDHDDGTIVSVTSSMVITDTDELLPPPEPPSTAAEDDDADEKENNRTIPERSTSGGSSSSSSDKAYDALRYRPKQQQAAEGELWPARDDVLLVPEDDFA